MVTFKLYYNVNVRRRIEETQKMEAVKEEAAKAFGLEKYLPNKLRLRDFQLLHDSHIQLFCLHLEYKTYLY